MYKYKHKVSLDNHIKAFTAHLGKKNTNKRVLFSAPFGSGKSFFLSTYFEDKSCNFLPITIFPVDYSVAANQDIFELIKHDILIQILESYEKDVNLQKEDVNFLVAGKMWVDNKLDLMPFIGVLSKITGDESIMDITLVLRQVFAEIKQHKKILSVDEEKDVIEYLAKEMMKSGSIREIDGVTTTIKELLKRIKDNNKEKEVVLVIEDMDRLDPEHIFRIFNVFSSHTDTKSDENKFGFDRVVFVCDITNVRHIYEHLYGSKVDFSGYISKFYSKEIFAFDLRKSLIEDLTTMYLNALDLNSSKDSSIQKNTLYDFKKNKVSQAFSLILSKLVNHHLIKIRELTKVYPFEVQHKSIILTSGSQRSLSSFPIIMIFNALKQLFSTSEDLVNGLAILADVYPQNYTVNSRTGNTNSKTERDILSWSIPFVVDEINLLAINRHESSLNVGVPIPGGETIFFTFKEDWDGILNIEDWTFNHSGHPPVKANIYYFLHLAALNSLKNGFIK